MNGLNTSFGRFIASVASISIQTTSCGVSRMYVGHQALSLLREEMSCALLEGMERTGLIPEEALDKTYANIAGATNAEEPTQDPAPSYGPLLDALTERLIKHMDDALATAREGRTFGGLADPAVLAGRAPVDNKEWETTAQARTELVEFFRDFIKRNDFHRYIAGDLAGDFAWSLMGGINKLRTALDHARDECGKLHSQVKKLEGIIEQVAEQRNKTLQRLENINGVWKSPDDILYEQFQAVFKDGPPHPGFTRCIPVDMGEVALNIEVPTTIDDMPEKDGE